MVFGLIGFINSGKGTIAAQLVNEYKCRQDSFAASLKDACSVMFDWPRNLLEGDTAESREWREITDKWWAENLNIPNFSPRLALQLVGTEALRNNFNQDVWFLTLLNRIRKNPNQDVVISDVRFPNEISFIKKQGGKLIQINRGQTPVWYETALLANKGNTIAKNIMEETYSNVHLSEWAWIGTEVDHEIDNNGSIDDLKLSIRKIFSIIQ